MAFVVFFSLVADATYVIESNFIGRSMYGKSLEQVTAVNKTLTQ